MKRRKCEYGEYLYSSDPDLDKAECSLLVELASSVDHLDYRYVSGMDG